MDGAIHAVCSPALAARQAQALASDLRRHTLIHNDSGASGLHPPGWAEWLAQAGVERVDSERGPRFSSTYIALEAAVAGHGVTLAAGPLIELDLASGRLVRPLALSLDNPWAFWIVCPRQNLQDKKVKAMTAWLLLQAKPGKG